MKQQLTQDLVDTVVPGDRDLFVWDTEISGFGLKVTPAGRLVYVFQFRLGGRSVPTSRITIGGTAEGWTVEQARSRAALLSSAVGQGSDPRLIDMAPAAATERTPTKGPRGESWQLRLGFLAGDVSRLQSMLLRRTMKQLGASYAQWGMLGQLALHQGVTQMELAQILGLSKVAVTGLVNRVVRAGWAERRLDERDRRVRRLFLTPPAKKAVAAMREEVDKMIGHSMGHVPDEQGEAIVAVFEGIKDRLLVLSQGARRRKKAAVSG